jgi:signal transduction histidine kinase
MSNSSSEGNSASEQSSPPEQEVRQLQEQLALAGQQLDALVREHKKRVEELSLAVEVRDEFIAVAAHELRNPMSAIVLFVQNLKLASRRAGDARPHRLEDKLEALERRIHHYVRRASLLLDVTRLTSGKFELEIEAVDLTQLTCEVASGFAEELVRADCQLDVHLAEVVTGLWDRMGLEQILMNLVSNAIKYGAGKPIRIALRADAGVATLEVEDGGMGISSEDQQRIFQKFERAVRRRHHGGFGIGLWITRQIAERMGGGIQVVSQPGRGSRFTVMLPQNPSAT